MSDITQLACFFLSMLLLQLSQPLYDVIVPQDMAWYIEILGTYPTMHIHQDTKLKSLSGDIWLSDAREIIF